MSNREHVAVGFDGSPDAWRALDWAAEHAAARGVPLRVVSAVGRPVGPPAHTRFPPADSSAATAAEETARVAIEQGVARCRAARPGLIVTGAVVTEPPIPAMRRESVSAGVLVVGRRNLNPVTHGLVGSVSSAMTMHADCPVVVVPAGEPQGPEAPVVAGASGADGDETVLASAFAEAARSGAPLTVIHARSDFAASGGWGAAMGFLPGYADLDREVVRIVEERFTRWAAGCPGVRARLEVVRAEPTTALLRRARGARLLVVGSHARHGLAGLAPGSVARSVVRRAKCPVLVSRTSREAPRPPALAPDPVEAVVGPPTQVDDEAVLWASQLAVAHRACCCAARPAVVVVLAPTLERPHPTDLLLCGHHYAVNRSALRALGVAAFDETGARADLDGVSSARAALCPVP